MAFDPFSGLSGNRETASLSPTSRDFALAKDNEQEGESRTENTGVEQVFAADYDPSLDRREDEYKRFGDQVPNVGTVDEEDEEEDVEDMFAVADSEKKVKKLKKVIVSSVH
jgi:serine/threonine-protein kinase PRP4